MRDLETFPTALLAAETATVFPHLHTLGRDEKPFSASIAVFPPPEKKADSFAACPTSQSRGLAASGFAALDIRAGVPASKSESHGLRGAMALSTPENSSSADAIARRWFRYGMQTFTIDFRSAKTPSNYHHEEPCCALPRHEFNFRLQGCPLRRRRCPEEMEKQMGRLRTASPASRAD